MCFICESTPRGWKTCSARCAGCMALRKHSFFTARRQGRDLGPMRVKRPWENPGKILGKSWENGGKTFLRNVSVGKIWKNDISRRKAMFSTITCLGCSQFFSDKVIQFCTSGVCMNLVHMVRCILYVHAMQSFPWPRSQILQVPGRSGLSYTSTSLIGFLTTTEVQNMTY